MSNDGYPLPTTILLNGDTWKKFTDFIPYGDNFLVLYSIMSKPDLNCLMVKVDYNKNRPNAWRILSIEHNCITYSRTVVVNYEVESYIECLYSPEITGENPLIEKLNAAHQRCFPTSGAFHVPKYSSSDAFHMGYMSAIEDGRKEQYSWLYNLLLVAEAGGYKDIAETIRKQLLDMANRIIKEN